MLKPSPTVIESEPGHDGRGQAHLALFFEESLPRLPILTGAVMGSDRLVAQCEARSLGEAAAHLGAWSLARRFSRLEREIARARWAEARDGVFDLSQRLHELRRQVHGRDA